VLKLEMPGSLIKTNVLFTQLVQLLIPSQMHPIGQLLFFTHYVTIPLLVLVLIKSNPLEHSLHT
jgi:hypothetical protein